MIRSDLAPFVAVGALVAGIAIGERVGPGPGVGALVLCALAIATVAVSRKKAGRMALLLVALALLGSALTQRALNGLHHWPLGGAADARADVTVSGTLVDDPDGSRFTSRVLMRVDRARLRDEWRNAGGRTVLVVAEGEAGPRLRLLDAGDHVLLRGWLQPLDGYDVRLRWRHAVARLRASVLTDFDDPRAPHVRFANALRGAVLRGTTLLPATEQALVGGFLLGDTRALPEPVVEEFRASGLSHLLAVSGENVAFVLALVGPALRRLQRRGRLLGTLAVLGTFGAMTRWEPSVLRACAMATCAVVAVHLGRPAPAIRLLAIAVSALLVVDPFLVHSVGFQLSCAATLGIAALGPAIAARLRGPTWFRESLGTAAAAQVGVAPVLIPVFGSLPLISLPANLLAVPIAGPLTIWGLAASAIAGAVRPITPSLAAFVQLPTEVMADAVLGIANAAARVPIAIDGRAAIVIGAVAVALVARRRRMLRRDAVVVPPR